MGPLATLFSTIDSAKRKFSGLLDNPGGTFEQLMGQMQDYRRQDQQLGDQAYGDPRKGEPLIKDKEAFAQLGQRAFDNVMSFAPAGITVWHGSPHTFSKFDSSKIGTGEGAQAYGHGLYFAESPDVAKQYRDILTGKTRAGQPLNWDDPIEVASMRLHQFQGDKNAAIEFVAGQRPNPNASKANAKAAAYADEVIEAIKSGKATAQVDGGNLYKVDLPDEHIAKMLDWDKPLSQQPTGKQLLQVAENPDLKWAMSWANPYYGNTDAFTASRLVSSLEGKIGPKATSEAFKQAGIPGIRYLDGGSRGVGQGTSNFVVFPGNEGLLSILERNGQPLR